ncbi:MAG: ATP-binding protein [Phycisphaeraceae bacterium]|nr:ATP-binding protein [Phycisphaeraceae bacterium]
MNQVPLRLKYTAALRHLPTIHQQILAFAEKMGVSHKHKNQIELVLEELLVNIISYAFTDEAEAHEIELIADVSDDRKFVMTLIDDGKPYDPLTAPEPNLDVDIEHREIGGLGVMLVKQLMDDVTYRRENSRNILKLTLNIDVNEVQREESN